MFSGWLKHLGKPQGFAMVDSPTTGGSERWALRWPPRWSQGFNHGIENLGKRMQSNGVWLTLASLVAKVWLETRAMQTRLRKQSRSCWVTFLKVQGLLKFANKWLHTEANCEQKTGTLSWTNQLPCSSHRSGGSWTRSWCSWDESCQVWPMSTSNCWKDVQQPDPWWNIGIINGTETLVTKQKSKAAGF